MGKRILTNKHGLPDTLVKAVLHDTHKTAGTISVTTLIDAPQIRYLKAKHDYESDVSENLYALMGTALHHILERANISSMRKRAFILTAETLIAESEKLLALGNSEDKVMMLDKVAKWLFQMIPILFPETIENNIFEHTIRLEFGKEVISGTFDLYEKDIATLNDYKFCSVWSWLFPESRNKWTEQANIYAEGIRTNLNLPVNAIRVIAFFRDWNEHGLVKQKDYPPRQTMEIWIPVWSREQVHARIQYHLDRHHQAEAGNVPDCTGEERWAKADEYAVMTPSAKRAIRVLDTPQAAQHYMQENRNRYHGMFMEERPGVSTRCEKYCAVSKFCPQYARELKKREMLKML